MIFVDTNVFMYAVGRAHPLQAEARAFFLQATEAPNVRLCTSAEVLQEFLHAYLPVQRLATLDAALHLARSAVREIWPIEEDDVQAARALVDHYAGLGARDLLHLACCRRRGITQIKSFDRGLQAAFSSSA
ncbi:MAG: type II toxin-antitoxin system VapC family toxin [Gammaproteobacteria bacterium]